MPKPLNLEEFKRKKREPVLMVDEKSGKITTYTGKMYDDESPTVLEVYNKFLAMIKKLKLWSK
jgi:hypothetical protein